MSGKTGEERRAHFVCVISLARQGRAMAVVSDRADGWIAAEPRGAGGFGYDPVFLFLDGRRSYAEATAEEKNAASHRGKAFQHMLQVFTPQK
jgi:XTP/dITP diphosphohydrolase